MSTFRINSNPASILAYSTPERLAQDFASRGLVVLAPESLGIPIDVHDRIYEQEKQAISERKRVTPSLIPDVLNVINAPGVVAACNQLVGENWAIVPFTHNASFTSGSRDQHWHKDDNGPYNSRKQRHHQAVQIEMLYYPQAVREDMGPTATVPYSHYWTFNHEENHDNFAGADHLDFNYQLNGMEREPVSGPDSKYDEDDIVHRRTAHDVRMREAITNLKWPLVQSFEAAPLRAGSVVFYSHNTFHRGNHRRDDWRTWEDNPRFMWRFWLYRTTDPTLLSNDNGSPAEVRWNRLGVDPLTNIDLTEANDDVTVIWRHHYHWMLTGQTPPPRPEVAALAAEEREQEAARLSTQLHLKHDEAEPARIGAAYKLASIGNTALAVKLLGQALYNDRESVRRAATYGLTAVGPDATSTLLEATNAPLKWVRKAGVYGLGDVSPLNDEVLKAVVTCLEDDPSVYVRSVAAGTLGCLGRRAIAMGVGQSLIPACLEALVQSLGREENRLAMDREQQRSIKFVRPTDECDVCEGGGVDFALERFKPVRSAVRENALWSIVILCSHGATITGTALEPTILTLKEVMRNDQNVICVGFAMDALNRLANLRSQDEVVASLIIDLQANLLAILKESPARSWEALVRGGLSSSTLSELDQLG
ncbi:TPA: HEAT repeat domain-containing protein [Candidatus Poribacteria bacterium]|nr:HEAT repeat domain-containing protein [Candidatus Poribacteria bacterium]HIC03448.1 HEAT repeat domain-containing protein [Candidatus Poribacteria bacterium]HIN30804.1 HEAT repeat domain-containing protein [Candidatus Poribacteria bacterium]HIO47154.1 HEAT repeat domain-containing protein [Candidatus Poribacteria bacterium]HIO82148.1 HEAT repeat domain-containing protein [Candidatus Poribacteria bacterium]